MKKYALLIAAVLTIGLILGGCTGSKGDIVGTDAGGDTGSKGTQAVKMVEIPLSSEDYGIGVDKDKPELLKKVNAFIKQIKEDGTFDEICSHYMEDGKPVLVESREYNEKRDQLLVASTLDFEPFEYGEVGEYYGIDMEIAAELAKYLNKDLVIVNSSFETMFMAVKQHKCDVCIGGITIKKEREKFMDFSDPYFTDSLGLAVPGDNTEFDKAKSKEDVEEILRTKDDKTVVAVEALTTAEDYVKGDAGTDGFSFEIKGCNTAQSAMKMLAAKEVDYVVVDSSVGHYIAREIGTQKGAQED